MVPASQPWLEMKAHSCPETSGDPYKALSGNKRAIWGISLWRDSVVPLAVEFGAFDVDCGHLGVRDDNAAGVLASIEFAAHGEAGFGGGGRDEFDDDPVADERLGAPVLADEGEEPVLASRAGESHPHALLEPYVNLSIHTAPDVRLLTCRKRQWAKRFGSARTTRANQSRAPFGRGRS